MLDAEAEQQLWACLRPSPSDERRATSWGFGEVGAEQRGWGQELKRAPSIELCLGSKVCLAQGRASEHLVSELSW